MRIPDHALGAGQGSRVERATRIALEDALADAGLGPSARKSRCRVGLAIGTELGEAEGGVRLLAGLPPEVGGAGDAQWELAKRAILPHQLAIRLAQRYALEGPATTFAGTCVSSFYAVEQAALDFAAGRADAVVAGGVEELGGLVRAVFSSLGALAVPDKDGRGLVLGEAAAFVVLEPVSRARERGARVRALVLGRGLASDGVHLTSADEEGRGMEAAIEGALLSAGLVATDVGWVSLTAHASPVYHRMYENVLGRVFGGFRPEVASWEPAVGHVLAATGTMGVVHAALKIEQAARRGKRQAGLALTVGFGGQNGAMVLGGPS